jgi:hypothetical protein
MEFRELSESQEDACLLVVVVVVDLRLIDVERQVQPQIFMHASSPVIGVCDY